MLLDGLQDGRYRSIRLLGSGGMGDVYLMEDTRINRRVAIKVIRSQADPYPNNPAEKDAARLFQREARAVAALDHPNILPLYDFGEERHDNVLLTYMVMPYCPDGSLNDWIRTHNGSTLLVPADVASLISQVADALQYAHDQQVIHLDVKLPNLLVRGNKREINHPTVLLTDFGVARFSAATSSESRTIRGTPTSMAPEQWSGNPVPATDQYALAVMVFTLLTGRPPFLGSMEQLMFQHFQTAPPLVQQFNTHLPISLNTVLQRGLAKKAEERFPSVGEFSDALHQVISASAAQAPTLSTASDLHATLAISSAEALDGAERTLTLPGGKRVVVNIPAGSYNGQVLRLQHLKDPTSGSTSSDILVLTLHVSLEEHVTPSSTTAHPTLQSSSSTMPTIPVSSPHELAASPSEDAEASNAVPYYQQSQPPKQASGRQTPGTPFAYPTPPSMAPPPPPETHVHRGGTKIWLLVALALLVILGSIATFFVVSANQTKMATSHATATAHANVIATAHASATAEVYVHATATMKAITDNPYAPGLGTLTLNDPLTTNSNRTNWDVSSDSSKDSCSFRNNAYDVNLADARYYQPCTASYNNYRDFVFEVQMKIIQGNSGGIIFRAGGATENLNYEFVVNQNGNCWLYSNSTTAKQLSSMTSSSLKQGLNQVNVIAVLAQGSTIKMFVNHQPVGTMTDRTYDHGKIGFVADPYNGSEKQVATEVLYNNAKVWQL